MSAERGHKVTLYEKNDFLGGLLRHTDFASFQWPIKDYKDFQIRRIKKTGVRVLLKTEATPDMIKKEGYDAVLFAGGTAPSASLRLRKVHAGCAKVTLWRRQATPPRPVSGPTRHGMGRSRRLRGVGPAGVSGLFL